MLGFIGLGMMLIGAMIYLMSNPFRHEGRILMAAALLLAGVGVLAVHGWRSMPEPEEGASVRESREAVKELARQAEAEAWYAQQKRVHR